MPLTWRPLPLTTPKAILTPCIGVCVLGSDGRCEGCLRSGDEIARWSSLSDRERQHIMDEVLPQRATAAR